jgi:hypothetical protein
MLSKIIFFSRSEYLTCSSIHFRAIIHSIRRAKMV